MNIKVSFCTTCHNRAHQLRQVFDANCAIIRERSDIEWVLLNYCSSDDLHGFVMDRLDSLPVRFVYAREKVPRLWHASVAKNIAHRLGSGRVLVNLDCDNRIEDAADLLWPLIKEKAEIVHLFSRGDPSDGTFGRIAVTRRAFEALGGYDESFLPMGYQDLDLIERAKAMGLTFRAAPCRPEAAIRNTKEESIRHCALPGMRWLDYNRLNREESLSNIAAGRLKANQEKGWTPMNPVVVRGGSKRKSVGVLSGLIRRWRGIRQRTILVGWELGGGMGHVNGLLPIVSELIRQDCRVVFASRDRRRDALIAAAFPEVEIVDAPHHRRAPDAPREANMAYDYADVLYRVGFADPDQLWARMEAWQALINRVRPDSVLCDHSPTLILACTGRMPIIHVGAGFGLPPAGKALMPLYRPAAAGAAERTAVVLEAIQEVLRRRGDGIKVERIADMFTGCVTIPCSLPELDPYASVRPSPALGPVNPLPAPLDLPQEAFVFGYLAAEAKMLVPLLEGLVRANIPCGIYIRDGDPCLGQIVSGSRVKLYDRPQPIMEALGRASAVLHHGGLATTEMALALGRPQFLVPRHLEQVLTTRAIERMGVGIGVAKEPEEAGALIGRALDKRTYHRAAALAAERLDARPAIDVLTKIVDACLQPSATTTVDRT